jgi:hypothetical protein
MKLKKKKNQDYISNNVIKNKLKFVKMPRKKIKMKTQRAKTYNTIKYWNEGTNWEFLSP